MISNITCIAVDLDGTLLDSNHQISPGTRIALQEAAAAGIHIIIATGKTRGSSKSVLAELGIATPGVYSQGLTITNEDGSIRHMVHLKDDLSREIAEAAADTGCSFVAYKDTEIYTTRNDMHTLRMIDYHEPYPIETGSIEELMAHRPLQKYILLQKSSHLEAISPRLKAQFSGRATVVNSQPDMLEILPLGSSKGQGLKYLLDELGFSLENTIAFGDADNDLEMIQWANIGVAMGNAMPRVKEAADFVTASNDEDGIASALNRFLFS